jgi:hypothetical protein
LRASQGHRSGICEAHIRSHTHKNLNEKTPLHNHGGENMFIRKNLDINIFNGHNIFS